MHLSEYAELDGWDLAELCRRGEVKPNEVIACAMRAVAALNDQLNFLVDWTPGETRHTLGELKNDMAFMGVPFMVKDIGASIAGVPQEMGSRLASGLAADSDSEIVKRFRAAGLVTLGRTTTPEFGATFTTESVAAGATRNPWNIAKSSGGSSGGAAAAVASMAVPIAHAGDSAGSIRIPAHCCGVFGLKPSRGRNPVGPQSGEINSGLTAAHVLTGTVRDSAAMLDAIAGPDTGCRYTAPYPDGSFLAAMERAPRKLKIAFSAENPFTGQLSPDMQAALIASARLCAELGHHVESATPPIDAESYARDLEVIWAANIHHSVDKLHRNNPGAKLDETVEATNLAFWERGASLSATELLRALDNMNDFTRQYAAFFDDFDILMTPTASATAMDIGTLSLNRPVLSLTDYLFELLGHAPFTSQCNVSGQPAMSIPSGLSADGMPTGIQYVARYGAEEALFSLAGAIEKAAPWRELVPPLNAGALADAGR